MADEGAVVQENAQAAQQETHKLPPLDVRPFQNRDRSDVLQLIADGSLSLFSPILTKRYPATFPSIECPHLPASLLPRAMGCRTSSHLPLHQDLPKTRLGSRTPPLVLHNILLPRRRRMVQPHLLGKEDEIPPRRRRHPQRYPQILRQRPFSRRDPGRRYAHWVGGITSRWTDSDGEALACEGEIPVPWTGMGFTAVGH
jgi:hypothetical protein